ncbi:MAG: tetratricopeptide repeat protein [Planctomycetota bacterium]|jgi:serine/threonine protein kinase/Tfp pilus assembly protein PilF
MDIDRWSRIKKIFLDALEREPTEREAFLDVVCRDDPDLRREVEALLLSHKEIDGLMELPTKAGLFPEESEEPLSSKRIGQYLLQRIISSGGMGTVYEALQESPRRTVAIKVMREGVASKSALRRFEYESQILASLRHPNIAQVIEAGTHFEEEGEKKTGWPYFVMEYIPDARHITDYAWEEELSLSDRLRLFLEVCDAVHHGHQKGIIHRDLKPSNLLVDKAGKVKIIDFGVARATDSDLSLTTAQTDVGQLIGTVQYMSPEQCMADPDELDIRSDVYALGVVLYELLCEELPYDVRKAVVFEATRVIREAPPKKPSTTKRALKGDAETIVLKALEKQRVRRYQSVADLGADIHRYLNGEVILAKPAGPATKTWKLVKRHPALSMAFGVALLSAFAFLGYILFVSYPQIRLQMDLAEQEKIKAIEAKAETEREAEYTKTINEFLEEMLSSANPFKEGGDVKLAEMVDRAAERIDREFPDRPAIEASLRKTIGKTYLDLGLYEKAEAQLKTAFDTYCDALGEEDPKTLRVQVNIGWLFKRQGRLSEAESLVRNTVENLRRILGEEHQLTLSAAHLLATVLCEQGDSAEAESLARETLDSQRRLLTEEHRDTLNTMVCLGVVLFRQGKYDEAESTLRKAVQIQQRFLGEEHPETLMSLNNLSIMLKNRGKYFEAEKILKKTVETCRSVLGEEHPFTLTLLGNLADQYNKQGQYIEAETILRSVIAVNSRILDKEHPDTLRQRSVLANVLSNQGNHSEAESILRDVLEIRRRTLGERHWKTILIKNNLALSLKGQDKLAEAETIFREIYAIQLKALGEEHPETLKVLSNLGHTVFKQGDYPEAERINRKVWECRCRKLDESHPHTIMSLFLLAQSLQYQDKLAEAEPLFRQGAELIQKAGSQENPTMAFYLVTYGRCLTLLERFEEAEKILLDGHEVLAAKWGDEDGDTKFTVRKLIALYEAWDKPGKAAEWGEKPH